jgi:hypothetical protein
MFSRCLIYKVHRPLFAVGFHCIILCFLCQELFSSFFKVFKADLSENRSFLQLHSLLFRAVVRGAELF